MTATLSTYPLIDPDQFFTVLPAMPWHAEVRRAARLQFDQHGYMAGEQGARISPAHVWTNRVGADPYDSDLSINVVWLPSCNLAEEGFLRACEKLKLPGLRVSELPSTVVHATQWRFVRIQHRAVTIYQLEACYQNYFFGFTARVNENRLFPTEEALAARLQALDRHIHETLEAAT